MSQEKTDFGERGETGEREPKGANRIEKERSEPLKGGVGQGMEDKPRNRGPMDSIHEEHSGGEKAYTHKREYTKEHY